MTACGSQREMRGTLAHYANPLIMRDFAGNH
jgi:hypothetical protein